MSRTMMRRVAYKVRQRKIEHPELYCTNASCLWLIVHSDGRITPCPRHGFGAENFYDEPVR